MAIAPPFGLTCAASSGKPSSRKDGKALRCKGFVQFDHIHLREVEICLGQDFLCGWDWAHAHDARCNTAAAAATTRAFGVRPMAADCFFRSNQKSARAIVYAGGISRGDGSIGLDDTFQFAKPSSVVSGRGCSSVVTRNGITLLLRNGDGNNFFREESRLHRRGGPLLAAECESILVGARNCEFLGDDFCGFGHEVGAIFCFKRGIDEAPAHGSVFQF